MSRNMEPSALAIVLSTLLFAGMLLFGVIKGSSNSDIACMHEDSWVPDGVGVESDASFDENYIHEIYLYSDDYGVSSSTTSISSGQNVNLSCLFINEFMADNSITIAGPSGNSPDWIELYNAGNETIDLNGMYLTDDLTDPTCWRFPDGTYIEPGEYLIVWANSDGGELYSSFSLRANGEEIGLFASDGETLIDSVVFAKQIQDVSYGRIPDGSSTWDYLPTPTPGSANEETSIDTNSSVWSLGVLMAMILVVGISVLFVGKRSARRNNND